MKITGEPKTNTVPYSQFGNYENQEITVTGTVHNIRMMSDFAFVILRTARETIQCVYALPIIVCRPSLKKSVR